LLRVDNVTFLQHEVTSRFAVASKVDEEVGRLSQLQDAFAAEFVNKPWLQQLLSSRCGLGCLPIGRRFKTQSLFQFIYLLFAILYENLGSSIKTRIDS